jgi:chloramphenicol O-acetyltransferase type A
MTKKIIDLNQWERKKHFLFFNEFDDPSFEITSNIECSKAYGKSREEGFSFFLLYLHCSLKAVNKVMEFKLRIENDEVVHYDKIHAAPTIARKNGTFGFSHLPFCENFKEFTKSSEKIIDVVKSSDDLEPSFHRTDVIHYSSIPWIPFTSLAHPRFDYQIKDSVPKISFGKMIDERNKKYLPVSITANHALMDAFHMAKHLQFFEKFLNE